jgi:hypothetical protein
MALKLTSARDVIPISNATPATSPKKAAKTKAMASLTATGDIPTSDALTGIELRIQNLSVPDNGTTWIPPFIRYSDLYVITVAVDNLGGDPYRVTLEGFANVDDGDSLSVDRTAYLWEKSKNSPTAPNQVHLSVTVVKSNAGIRKLGAALTKLKASDDYKSVVAAIAKAAASSGGSAIADGVVALTGLVGSLLTDVEDSPLYHRVISFTGINGDFDNLGRHVRDHGRVAHRPGRESRQGARVRGSEGTGSGCSRKLFPPNATDSPSSRCRDNAISADQVGGRVRRIALSSSAPSDRSKAWMPAVSPFGGRPTGFSRAWAKSSSRERRTKPRQARRRWLSFTGVRSSRAIERTKSSTRSSSETVSMTRFSREKRSDLSKESSCSTSAWGAVGAETRLRSQRAAAAAGGVTTTARGSGARLTGA